MIVHVMRRAEAANVGAVAVATNSQEIAACVEKAGGRAVMTRADHASGLGPHLRGAGEVRPASAAPASSSTSRATCRRSRPPTSRARSSRSPIRRSTSARLTAEIKIADGAHQSERREGRRHAGRRAALARALFHPRHRALRATGRSITTSASMPIAARRCERFVGLPPSPARDARESSSSCARWKPACAST